MVHTKTFYPLAIFHCQQALPVELPVRWTAWVSRSSPAYQCRKAWDRNMALNWSPLPSKAPR